MGFFRWVARHEMFLGIVTVAVIIVTALWILLNALNINIVFGSPPAAGPAVQVTTATTPEATATPPPTQTPVPVSRTNAPTATEAFMIGQVNGNADQVWDAMSASLHQQLAGAGKDKTYYQRLFEAQKKSGLVYQGYQYVGGVPGENGDSIHFYVLNVLTSDSKIVRVPWTFVVDKDNKISNVETSS